MEHGNDGDSETDKVKFRNNEEGTSSLTSNNDNDGLSDAECLSCRQVTSVNGNWDKFHLEEADVSYGLGQLSVVRCTSCLKSLGLIWNGTFHTLGDVLYDKTKETDGWLKAETEWDKRVLFTLSQIIYKEVEEPDESLMEVEFAFPPPPSDLVKLLWLNFEPVGFYTVKLKGTLDVESMSWYTMTTLDTLFIRKCYRGKGFGYSAIKSLLTEFPDQNIGFSYPVSLPMKRVLRKHLELTPSDRSLFWEVSGCGTPGNTRNLWLMFNRPKKLS